MISNSTLMPTSDGSQRAIVHFEVTIESFRKVAASLANRSISLVVEADRPGGARQPPPQQIGAPLGIPDDHRFQPVRAGGQWPRVEPRWVTVHSPTGA